MPGTDTSAVEVTDIAEDGFWLVIDRREFFLPFEDFPWFREASVAAIRRIERPQPDHLLWPDLDVDLAVASIEDPSRYPLAARP